LALGLVALIGWLDFITGPEFGLSLFLAVPVFMASRRGMAAGLTVAASAVGAWVVARIAGRSSFEGWGILVRNATLRCVFFSVVVALAQMKRRIELERTAASTDVLTGLMNRRGLEAILLKELARSRRSGRSLTVVYLDCDNFKAINDRFGHGTGDKLLQAVAATLILGFREGDITARIGGDEFAALLVDADIRNVRGILERAMSALRAAMTERGRAVTFSLGAATSVSPPATATEALAEGGSCTGQKRGARTRSCTRSSGRSAHPCRIP
jgi:diguanylate cyclase (GGDEF)-like protein